MIYLVTNPYLKEIFKDYFSLHSEEALMCGNPASVPETNRPCGVEHITTQEFALFALDTIREAIKHLNAGNCPAVRKRLEILDDVLSRRI